MTWGDALAMERRTDNAVGDPKPGATARPRGRHDDGLHHGGVLGVMRRLGWGVADQAVSSLENFLVGAYVAHVLGAGGLGTIALVFLAYSLVTNVSRALATDPLVVNHSIADQEEWRVSVSAATGTAFLVGAVASVASAALGAVLMAYGDHSVGLAFLLLAPGLPGLTLQDSWRFAFFCVGRGRGAFVNDVVWTVLLLGALGLGSIFGVASLAWSVAAFGATAWVAGAFGMIQSRIVPALRRTPAWLDHTRELGLRFVVENVTLAAGGQVRSVVLATSAGLDAVGAVRGAEMLIGPIAALVMGIAQVAVPEAARALQRGERAFRRLCLGLSCGLASLSALWGLALLVILPFGPGRIALGSVWPAAHVLLIGMTLAATAQCFQVGPGAGLRAMARADLTWRCQALATAAYVVLGAGGAVVDGARGAVWGTCGAAALGAAMWTVILRRATTARFEESGAPGAVAVAA